MTTRSAQIPSLTGAALTYFAAAAGGDKVPADGHTVLHVKNAHATLSRVVTIVTPGALPTGSYPDLTVTVPALGDRLIGPLPAALFEDPTDHLAHVTYSTEADLSFAVLRA